MVLAEAKAFAKAKPTKQSAKTAYKGDRRVVKKINQYNSEIIQRIHLLS